MQKVNKLSKHAPISKANCIAKQDVEEKKIQGGVMSGESNKVRQRL